MQKAVVLFDSSFLMAIAEAPTTWNEDIAERMGSFEPVVLDRVKYELRGIAQGSSVKRARFAVVAAQLAADFRVERASRGGDVDDEVISYAAEHGAAIATMDSDLIERAKALHIRVVTLSGRRVSVR